MTTQITFTTDESIKRAMLEKVKQDGITLNAFLVFCMKEYLQGKLELGMTTPPESVAEETEVKTKVDKITQIDTAALEENDRAENYTKIRNFDHLKKMLQTSIQASNLNHQFAKQINFNFSMI